MKAFLTLTLSCALVTVGWRSARGDTPDGTPKDVGIDEKLGSTVPLDITLVDEQGDRIPLSKLLDKPTILTLNYFRCAGLCTPLLNGVAEMLSRIDAIPGKDFQVLTVSFDPSDTAELAERKKANYIKQLGPGFSPNAWRFMTGDPVSTKRLADSVGFRFAKRDNDFIHAGVIMVLSPSGKIARYLYGVTFLPFDVKMAISEASQGRTGPTISRFLRFCFSYDPSGRRYYMDITRIAAGFTLALAAGFGVAIAMKGRRRSKSKDKEPS